MADVTPSTATGASERDRGQLFLVGALALAVLLVSLALLLNTAIYTENLATRSSDPGSADAITYQQDAVAGVGGVVDYTNAVHAADEPSLGTNLSASVSTWDNASARHHAVDARATNASLRSTTFGAQVVQNQRRNFSNATGVPGDWTLVEDVSPTGGLRAFRLVTDPGNVSTVPSPASPSASNLSSTTFYVNVTEDDGDWRRIHVYQNASEVQVAVYDGATVRTSANCSASPTGGNVTVDLTGGTVGGSRCGALDVFSTVDSDFDVRYRNVDSTAVEGTYSLVVNESFNSGLLVVGGQYAAYGSGQSPYVAPAVYAVRLNLTYESRRVAYRNTVRVAPGETDD